MSIDNENLDTIVKSIEQINKSVSDSISSRYNELHALLSTNHQEVLSSISRINENRIIGFISNELFWTITGGLFGIIFSLLVWLGKWILEAIEFNKKYGEYKGYYVSYIANNINEPHYILKVNRKRNEFEINGVSVKRANDGTLTKRHENIKGNIKMGTSSSYFGTGQYQHDIEVNNDGKIRSGEYRIQLAPNKKFITIQHIIDNELKESNPKYIWEPLNEFKEKDKEYIDFYKTLMK